MATQADTIPYEPLRVEPTVVTGRYAVLAFLCTAAVIAYVQRSGIAVAASAIQHDLLIDKARFGVVLSAWALGYALMQIPSGWLADRLGSQRGLTLYAVLWSIATGLVSQARDFTSLLMLWALMGVAQAGLFPCAAKAVSRWFAPVRRASASGLLASAMGIGGAIAPLLTGVLMQGMTWRWVFFIYAFPGLVWALIYFKFVPESPAETTLPISPRSSVESFGPAELSYGQPETRVWRTIAGSGSMWLLCGQQFLRAAGIMFFATWFPTFLHESRGISLLRAGVLTTLAGAGLVLGALLGGVVSDRILRLTGNKRLSRQGIAVAGMASCAVLIVCAFFVKDTTLAVSVIAAGAFCAAFGGVSGYTVAIDLGGRRVATVFSVMNMCGNIGAASFPLAVGWLVHRTGNWDLVLFIFAGIFAVDAVCWFLLNPKQPLFEGN